MAFPKEFTFRVKPWKHQRKALTLSWDKEDFALFMEQGTGKTPVVINTAAMLYLTGKIEMLIVIAPDGVQRGWIKEHVPKHMSKSVKYVAAWWENAPTKKLKAQIDRLMDRDIKGLRILAINYETLATAYARKAVRKYLDAFTCLLVADESHKIKNHEAARSKVAIDLSAYAEYRRILTGTPVAESPLDAFGQFQFLDPEMLGTRSYVAFKSEFAEIEAKDSPKVWAIVQRIKNNLHGRFPGKSVAEIDRMMKHRMPVIPKTDPLGRPIFRNLDKLQKLIAPYSFRCLKSECMDLPPKVYEKRYVVLTPEQRRLYDEIRAIFLTEYEEQMMAATMAVTRLVRLAQITSGFFKKDADSEEVAIKGGHPKIDSMMDAIAETQGKVVIWSRFVPELRMITKQLVDEYGPMSTVRYWGEVNKSSRDQNKKRFETEAACRFFVGHPVAGGTGVDGIQVAGTVIYVSNDYSLITRLQSEDRTHRGGSEVHNKVTYIDIVAEDTLDNRVIDGFLSKQDVSDLITGDPPRNWL